jgi:hypothetical protein
MQVSCSCGAVRGALGNQRPYRDMPGWPRIPRSLAMNCVHFQLAMLAYNLNCWLLLFNREEKVEAAEMKHTQLSTARLRFLFLAAKIWSHSGRVGVRYKWIDYERSGKAPTGSLQ